jgi:hypothetical protein
MTDGNIRRKARVIVLATVLVSPWPSPGAEPASWVSGASNLGPVHIAGIPAPPGDKTYDWRAYTIKDGDRYTMWWVRGVPWDRVFWAEGADGLHYGPARQVLAPVENSFETQHVGYVSVIRHPEGRHFMFYEAPMHDEWTDGPDNNIFLATSPDGTNWTKHPSNADPKPVIAGYNRRLKRYGVGQPSAFYKDGRFVLYYVDDCEGHGNRMRRAESLDGFRWGAVASQAQSDPRQHPVVMRGNVGEVKYSKTLNRCLMAFTVSGALVGQPAADHNHDLYVAVSLDPDGKRWAWAAQPPNIWDLAKLSYNLSAVVDRDRELRLRVFPTFVCNPLGHVEGKTLRLIYTKGRQADAGQDWKVHWATWDLYCSELTLE